MALYIEFMLLTVCRVGELNNLKWNDISEKSITFSGKTGKRQFPINEELKALIDSIPQTNEYFLADENGDYLGKHNRISRLVKYYIDKAELPGEKYSHLSPYLINIKTKYY